MKKIIIVLVTFFSFMFLCKAETNKGMLYEKYWQAAGVNVFASDVTYGAMDYNGWMIVSTSDDNVYYCVEPELEMYNSSNAINGAYTIYRGQDIINNTRFTPEMAERVKLLAYYGYKYPGHEDKKWYGITQVLIWKTVIKSNPSYKNTDWVFKDSRYGNTNYNLYKNEVVELERLVANHKKKPAFDGQTYRMNIGDRLTLNDGNGVLPRFDVSTSDIVDITKDCDSLVLTAKNIGVDTINLTAKSVINEEYQYLHANGKQDVVKRSLVDEISSNFNIEVVGGKVTLFKKDKETGKTIAQGDATLLNAKYNIYDMNDNLVKEVVIERQGMEVFLPYGKYKIKEVSPPVGYVLNEEEYVFDIDENNKEVSLDLYDVVIKGTHIINKVKGGAGEDFTYEEGAIFKVINSKGEEVGKIKTFKKGVGLITLPYGKYRIVQEIGADFYAFAEDYVIDINTDKKEIEVDLSNIKYSKLEVLKTDKDGNYLSGALIEIYKEDDTLIYKGKTNKDGKLILPNLDIGKYYLIEKEAPKYYKKSDEKYYFDVVKHGDIIKLNIENERILGNFKLIKKDKETGEALSDVKFSIYKENGDLAYSFITNKDGEFAITSIPAGKYYLVEESSAKGYLIDKSKKEFEILDDTLVEITLYNSKVSNPSTMDKVFTHFVLCSMSIFSIFTIVAVKYKVKIC